VVHCNVGKSDVSNAMVIVRRWDGSDCHSDSIVDNTVTNYDVFSASCNLSSFASRLDSDSVVKIGNVNALNCDVRSRRINSISVERECGKSQSKIKTKEFSKIELSPDIDVDFEIVDPEAVDII